MNRERWARIDELCNAAVSLEPGDRGSFLRKACGGDQELEREVESLLALQPAAEEFLEVPAAVLEAETVSRLPDHAILVPGTRLGHRLLVCSGAAGWGLSTGRATRGSKDAWL